VAGLVDRDAPRSLRCTASLTRRHGRVVQGVGHAERCRMRSRLRLSRGLSAGSDRRRLLRGRSKTWPWHEIHASAPLRGTTMAMPGLRRQVSRNRRQHGAAAVRQRLPCDNSGYTRSLGRKGRTQPLRREASCQRAPQVALQSAMGAEARPCEARVAWAHWHRVCEGPLRRRRRGFALREWARRTR
jgi:hypothetical protein